MLSWSQRLTWLKRKTLAVKTKTVKPKLVYIFMILFHSWQYYIDCANPTLILLAQFSQVKSKLCKTKPSCIITETQTLLWLVCFCIVSKRHEWHTKRKLSRAALPLDTACLWHHVIRLQSRKNNTISVPSCQKLMRSGLCPSIIN